MPDMPKPKSKRNVSDLFKDIVWRKSVFPGNTSAMMSKHDVKEKVPLSSVH